MKRLIFFASSILLLSFAVSDTSLTKKERKDADTILKDSESGVFASVKGLSDAQLKFKPAPDKWSVEECVKHIAISQHLIMGMVEAALKQPANPEKRAEIKVTDEQLIKNLEDRSTKIKTIEPMKPENTAFKSEAEALDSFKVDRSKLIDYVNHTQDDLRDHILALPIGTYDCYQLILLIGAHTNRHTQQIEEIKADANFPKN